MSKEYEEFMNRKREQREANVENRLAREAQAERDRRIGAAMDKEFIDGISDIIGGSIADARAGLDMSSAEDRKFEREVLSKLAKAQKSGNTRKAKKIANKNKTKLRAATKKGKKGCLFSLVAFIIIGLAVFITIGYGTVQVVAMF